MELIIKINKNQKYLEPLPPGLLSWVPTLLTKPASFIIQQAGLDGYFFLRYLLVISGMSFFALLLMFPILLPINATGGNGSTGLNQLTFSNVRDSKKFYAHAILSLIFFSFVLYIIYRELIHYTNLRQSILASPKYAYKLSSRVVLFQSVPKQYLNEKEFKKLFPGVKRIWMATADKNLGKKVKRREKLANNLENTLNSLLAKAVKIKDKADKKGKILEPIDELIAYIPQKKRPTYRKYKIFGEKKDKVQYLKDELEKVNEEIEHMKSDKNANKSTMNSIFVEFENQYYAQLAHQSIVHHKAFTLSEHFVGIEPDDVIWINMRMFWYERLVRKTLAVAAIVTLIIFWAIPVAFVGAISNVDQLTNKLHFLNFIHKLGKTFMGLVTSLLPTILLSILMALLPIFIRLMAKVAGSPTSQHVEYFTQQAYFAFQVIHVFLITTISSSAASVVTKIAQNPTSAMSLLSKNLPSASNFFVSYIMLQSFSIAGSVLLQLSTLVLFYVLGFILDKTARKKWKRYTNLSSNSWGTDFPPYTNLAVIMLAYSIISPIVLLFSAVGFAILYVVYLYFLCYVNNNGETDSRGIHYPRALFQTIVGVYLAQICLLGLFVVSKAWGPVVIDAIGLGITAFVHVNLNKAFDELMLSLPIDTMRALDGKSETPSYFQQLTIAGNRNSQSPSDFEASRVSRMSESTQYDSKLITEKEFVLQKDNVEENDFTTREDTTSDSRGNSATRKITFNEAVDYYDSLTQVPLLAEGTASNVVETDGLIKRFFKPHVYLSYHYSKRTLPEIYNHVDVEDMDEEKNVHAYDYPALNAEPPIVWIPRDKMGISKNIIKSFEGIIEISDEGAEFNSKNKIVFTAPPPDFDEKEKVQLENDVELKNI